MIGKSLQQALGIAVHEVKRRRHEYLTLEHLLFGITLEPHGKALISACGGDPEALRLELEQFLELYVETVDEISDNIYQTVAVQRVMDSALTQLRSAGKDSTDLEVGDVLAAMLDEKDAHATACLLHQGIDRLKVLEQISELDEEVETEQDEPKKKDPLRAYTQELTEAARSGQLDPLIGREAELSRTLEILARRRKNNPLYIGEPGTGKTALAEGLALKIAEGAVPAEFRDSRLFSLDLGAVLAGARYRGDFEGRIKAVLKALENIPNAILFIDEIHTIVGAGATGGSSMDASNLLKPVLAEGKIRCIGSTTYEEFRNHLEKDRALARRFQRIDVREPSSEECVDILKGLQPRYEAHHKVRFTPSAVRAAVELSARFVQDRMLPDKAIDVLDEAGAAVHLRTGFKEGAAVTRQEIERIVARMAGVPARTVSGREKDRLRSLAENLRSVLYGQDEAIADVTRAILRSRAGLGRSGRPAGSFLFYGPTGVGKTELARQLAEKMGIAFLRFDMSEYMEKHAVARLIGSPPGYVGFEQGGLLTEAVRKTPYAVVLLDEIEKAHPDVYNVLLQVMDYATLTDNTGRKADFRNCILIMTSNAGARDMAAAPMGFVSAAETDAARKGRKAVEEAFSPEFRNRLDAMVPFHGLNESLMGRIVDKAVQELARGLIERKVSLILEPEARDWLARKGFEPALGARPLQRLVREEIEDRLAEEVLFGKLVRGGTARIRRNGDSLELSVETA